MEIPKIAEEARGNDFIRVSSLSERFRVRFSVILSAERPRLLTSEKNEKSISDQVDPLKKVVFVFTILNLFFVSKTFAQVPTIRAAKQICDSGDAKACLYLGYVYSRGKVVKMDAKVSRKSLPHSISSREKCLSKDVQENNRMMSVDSKPPF